MTVNSKGVFQTLWDNRGDPQSGVIAADAGHQKYPVLRGTERANIQFDFDVVGGSSWMIRGRMDDSMGWDDLLGAEVVLDGVSVDVPLLPQMIAVQTQAGAVNFEVAIAMVEV